MSVKTGNTIQFLSGGGEMGELIRKKDWSQTPLGRPEEWPQSLLTTLSIILNSKFPMFLWWGPDLTCFYNDAYRPSLGENGKHPSILGQCAEEAWPEIWTIIKPLIDQVLAGGEATWSEDQLIPIYRNGKIEDVYWTFSYSPVIDESGTPAGVFVTCYETTEKVKVYNNIKEREEQLNFTVNAAELATWDLNPITNKFVGNDRLMEWLGLPLHQELELPLALNQIIEEDRQRVIEAMQATLQPDSGGNFETQCFIVRPDKGDSQLRKILAKGKAVFNEEKISYRFSGTLQDITQQYTALKKAEESEKRFRSVADSAPVLIWMAGTDMLCNFFNKAWINFTGRTLKQEMGKGWTESIHPEDLDRSMSIYIDACNKQEEFYMEYRLKRNDGEYRWISNKGVPRHNSDGSFEGYIGACMDIHETTISQKKIKDNEDKLNLVIKTSELGIWELDLNSHEINYSERFLEIFGHASDTKITHEELVKQIHPDDRAERSKAFDIALSTGVLQYESRLIWNDGSIHWMEAKGKVFYDEHNKTVKLLGTIQDITEEKNRERNLQESEQKFRLLADSMPQHIWTADTEGNLNYYNQSVMKYSGLTLDQIHAGGWLQIVHPDDRDENIKAWTNSIINGEDFLFEHRFRRADGVYRWQLSRAIPQRDNAGNIQMWVGTSTDIQDQKEFTNKLETEVLERTRELEYKNKELEKMNAELKSFAYVSSHDLQEPLRKIQTFSARILEKEQQNLSEKGQDYFQRMQSAAKRMQTLIEDLLAYSRTNTMERVFVNTPLIEIITDVKNELKDVITEKEAVIETDLKCKVNVIPFQFRQLMGNLLSNSLKFSKAGTNPHITIRSTIADSNEMGLPSLVPNQMYCHVSITDNGIGFDQQYHDRIFQVFQRLHGREQYEGTGIGLAIVKKIVENHNGVVLARGELGKGATFDIYLPV